MGQVLRADYILSVIRQTVLKKPGRGATVPAALKFIPQYVAAVINLYWTLTPTKTKKGRGVNLPTVGIGIPVISRLSCAQFALPVETGRT